MNWKGTRVVVTGAGGFIGSHLAEALASAGATVRALVHYNSKNSWGFLERTAPEIKRSFDVWSGDVCDPYFTAKLVESQDVVFHLAALIAIPYSYVAPASFVAVNVSGTLNILEACLRHKIKKLVQTSTSEVYGTARYVPMDESHPLTGQSPYSASKIAADALAESFHRSYGLPVAVVRPFNTFGPRQSARAVIPAVISQVLQDKKNLELGSLTPIRDFSYVSDTVAGFMAAGRSPASIGQVINIGSGSGVSIRQVVEKIFKLTGKKLALKSDSRRIRPKNSEVGRLICHNGKARKLLGWKPRVSLETGLQAVISHMRAFSGDYKSGVYNI